MSFVKPKGICFLFGNELPASVLSSVLCKITNFLQEFSPYIKLHRYDDWWEHDGLHFYSSKIDFNALYRLVNSPKNLLGSTPDEDSVFVGIAPEDNSWYLHFRVEWNDEETNLIGSCAIILTQSLVEQFKNAVLHKFEVKAEQKNSEDFYREVIL